MIRERSGGYLRVFLIAAAVSAVFFVPAMIWDRGYFIFLGDFNSQQIPFYQLAHKAVHAGNLGWNWYTDLGANFIGTYSFYLLGSPFFWLTMPFPNSFLPYLMGPLLILKFACAATTSYAWLKRHVQERSFAQLGGLLYAFSGFSIYNIFFNHFHEPMIFFPLLLIAIDELVDNGTKGVFALAVCVNCVVSYFFFVGEVVFTVVYFFTRFLTKGYVLTWKRFIQLALEAVLGMLMSMFLFWPSLLVMLSNYRVNNYADGFDLWIYVNNQRVPAILFSFLFPNELPSKQILLPDASVKWTSLTAYLPLFSCAGALAYCRTRRRNWLKSLLVVLLIMALVPAFNSLFVAMNRAYYTRWFYMFTLMLVLATIKMLDEGRAVEMERMTLKVLIVTAVLVVILAVTPDKLKDGTWRIGLFSSDSALQFAVITSFALISLGISLLLLDILKKDPVRYAHRAMLAVCILAAFYGNFYIIWGKTRSYDTHEYMIPDVLEGSFRAQEDDPFFRIDADDSCINIGMFWEVPCIRAFNSLVPASIFEFYDFIGEHRGVKSVPEYDQYPIRSMLSVKYFVDAQDVGEAFLDSSMEENEIHYTPKMPGFELMDVQNHYDIYENRHFIPMGFFYDSYCTVEEAETVTEKNRPHLMLQSMILSEEDADTYGSLFADHIENPKSLEYSEDAYYAACEDRNRVTADSFTQNGDSFTATMHTENEGLAFFSVPYDEGWTAYVNGAQAPIVKANIGFMAVPVPAGDSTIEFRYKTPGGAFGAAVSAAGFAIWGIYLLTAAILNRKKRAK